MSGPPAQTEEKTVTRKRVFKCYSCGKVGHMSKECAQSSRALCPVCVERHPPKQCPMEDTGPPKCHKCGNTGHTDQSCPKNINLYNECFSCGEQGHILSHCRKLINWTRVCYSCGALGHIEAGCTSRGKSLPLCFHCGVRGHLSRACPDSSHIQPKGRGYCFNCGELGHTARDCPEPRASSMSLKCYLCEQLGHVARDCPSDAGDSKPGQRFAGGGGGRSKTEVDEVVKEKQTKAKPAKQTYANPSDTTDFPALGVS